MTSPLVLYFNGTFINNENGAHARMRHQLAWAVANFPKVVLYSFADHPDCPWGEKEIALFRAEFPTVELVLDRRSKRLDRATRLKNACLALAPQLARRVLSWHVKGATPGYDGLLARGAHTLLVNYADAVSQLNGVDPRNCIIETHDLKFLHYAKKYGRPISDIRVMGKLRSEAWVLGAVGGLIAIAPPESAMFRLWYPDVPVFYIPSYPEAEMGARAMRDEPRYDLLFVGSENHFNVDGISRFLSDNAGWLSAYRIAIAGRVCNVPRLQELAARFAEVSLLGYVEELGAVYAQTRAVISPVEGTGLKMKVIEALRCGKPVFASEHSVHGLPPGSEACVFALNERAIAATLADAGMYDAACRAALEYCARIDGAGDADKLRDLLARRLEANGPRPISAPAAIGELVGANP